MNTYDPRCLVPYLAELGVTYHYPYVHVYVRTCICTYRHMRVYRYDPRCLVPYLAELGVTYHYLSKPIIEMAKTHMDRKRPSLCSFCSRIKRGLLYSCMREVACVCVRVCVCIYIYTHIDVTYFHMYTYICHVYCIYI